MSRVKLGEFEKTREVILESFWKYKIGTLKFIA